MKRIEALRVRLTWAQSRGFDLAMHPMVSLWAIVPVVLLCTRIPSVAGAVPSFTVHAGGYDRAGSMVAFQLGSQNSKANMAVGDNGRTYPLQVMPDGRAFFLVTDLKKGESRSYVVAVGKAGEDSNVEAKKDGTALKLQVGGQPVLTFQAEPGQLPRPEIKPIFQRGAFIHPILTPQGRMITDSYPPNHLHHHGIWASWTSTEFEGRKPDFWNMGDNKGTVEFVSLEEVWSGRVLGGFRSRQQYVDLMATPRKVALDEIWDVRVHNTTASKKPMWIFDIESMQTCATTSPLKLPQYRYGGLGFRGNGQWDGANNAVFTTSEGETNRVRAHEQRARWCHIGGRVNGEWAGLAIMCHPMNFRAPQAMRVHPTEPFFNYAPCQTAEMEIEPGRPLVARYRMVVMDGRPDAAELDRLWKDFAHPPGVMVEGR